MANYRSNYLRNQRLLTKITYKSDVIVVFYNRLLFTYGFVKSFGTSKKVTSYVIQWSHPGY